MPTETIAPVQLHEADEALRQLKALHERAEACGQGIYAFVFHTAYESLQDNLATAADMIEDPSDA